MAGAAFSLLSAQLRVRHRRGLQRSHFVIPADADARTLPRYGARPGRRGWLCEPHANGHSVAPANPAGVLEMPAWSPAVQKAAGLLSRSCRNRREQDPDVVGNFSSPPLKIDHIF